MEGAPDIARIRSSGVVVTYIRASCNDCQVLRRQLFVFACIHALFGLALPSPLAMGAVKSTKLKKVRHTNSQNT